jgi:hypothetical protein
MTTGARSTRLPSPDDPTQLEPGIAEAVRVLRQGGIETFESCEGGEGHSCFEPTIRFHGSKAAGFRAVSIAMENGLRPRCLRRYYRVSGDELDGPYWEITLWSNQTLSRVESLSGVG